MITNQQPTSLVQPTWEISEKAIYSQNQQVKGYKAIFRNDDNGILNVCKSSYTPTTNARFIESVERMSNVTGFPIRSYSEYEGGRKILAFLECTEPIQVQGYDFQDYMMIGNSHDSSTGFFIGNSSKMIRCSNRFSKIFRQLQVNHTKNNDVKIEQLLRYFETFTNERKALFASMDKMASIKIDDSLKTALIERIAGMTNEERLGTKELSTRKANIINDIWKSVDTECLTLGDNAFGLFNGITHYTTHTKKTSQPVFGNCLGGLARINAQAFEFCEAL